MAWTGKTLSEDVTFSFFFSFFFFFLAFLWQMELPGKESDPSSSWGLCCSLNNAGSLSHNAGLGFKPVSQRSRDATNPVAPQWELLGI